jgi:hypothetical protein
MEAIALMACLAARQSVACDYVQHKAAALSKPEPKPAIPIAIPEGDPNEILQNALDAQRQVTSLRSAYRYEGSATRTLLTEWTPDRT